MNRSRQLPKASWLTRFSILFAIVAILPRLKDHVLRREYKVHTDGAVIISGTSTGLGRAACGHLAEKHPGITFYCGVRKKNDGQGYPFTLANVVMLLLDVTSDSHVNATISKVQQSGHDLVGVINNAGFFELGTVEFQNLETVKYHFEVNVFGAYRLTQSALPLLRSTHGRVISIGSIAGKFSPARFSAYSGTKHALEAFSDALRRELLVSGISVSLLQPGTFNSPMLDKVADVQEKLSGRESETEETQSYPTLFEKEKLNSAAKAWKTPVSMDDTIGALDDAMFGCYPKARYVTSEAGSGIPSW
eukprot:CAMPEP_0183311904 /NCGR_PEP_ID=MMETSP0160_2-20130417/39439_1 /TAXON_ID=2839 ORGANISM="Odontella Sinensis, Strain Grunow 1884" /NCGR_SAMPLE_ID=MMETSP0160_2 /ASSEMBLY_ACC=CAM_ASM_000250 /LENGTH=304 /DNA_ID=CAMNT_0025476643 /DNA_START=45 /DNA_END=956 /DNA_ORIENTATION=-